MREGDSGQDRTAAVPIFIVSLTNALAPKPSIDSISKQKHLTYNITLINVFMECLDFAEFGIYEREGSTVKLYCSLRPTIEERPLIDLEKAAELEGTFKVLANGTRLRLLHALIRRPDMCVSELAEKLKMKMAAISNQLQLLTLKGILASKRNGNQISYRIIDPCTKSLLDYGLCLTEELAADAEPPVAIADEAR
jgi:DNA-binding transcriptional ArsR family regulator